MNRSTNVLLKFSQLFVLTVLTSLSVQAYEYSDQQSFSGADQIKISSISGDVKIVSSNTGEIEVSVKSTYDEDKVELIMELDGNVLKLKEKSTGYGSYSGQALWTVALPEGLNPKVSFNTASGDFSADDVTASLKINTASGDIKLTNFTGDAVGNTASGDIRLNKVNGKMVMNTASGDVKAKQSEGSFKLNTASGDVSASDIAMTGSSKFNTASGDVDVKLTQSPSHNIKMSSASGDVELDMQGNALDANISMKTRLTRSNNIHAPFDFDNENVTSQRGKKYIEKTATVGSGAVDIKLFTSSGDVTIKD